MPRSRFVPLVVVALLLAACGAEATQPTTEATESTAKAASTSTAPKARPAAKGVRLVKIGSFSTPVFLTAPRTDRSREYVVQQTGRIIVVHNGHKLATPFLDVSKAITAGGEEGLLGLAFAPDFASSGLFYVYYTLSGERYNQVVEYHATSPDRADPSSARVVLRIPNLESNHNGGDLVFGPDGDLYIGSGDGGGANDQHGSRGNAQNLGVLQGKILRIDPRRSGSKAYTIPASNPFVHRGGARGEIYAYGLRNPWRFSFDRKTGAISVGDVGQDQIEEVDYARRGGARGVNYGWRVWEGRRHNYANETAAGAVFPVLTQSHGNGWCSITGGYIARDPSVPGLYGKYVYGDYCKSQVWTATLSPGHAAGDRRLAKVPTVPAISSFGEDASGRLYVVSLAGAVYRFAAR